MLYFIALIDKLICYFSWFINSAFCYWSLLYKFTRRGEASDRVNFHLNGLFYYFTLSLPRRTYNRIIKSINTPV